MNERSSGQYVTVFLLDESKARVNCEVKLGDTLETKGLRSIEAIICFYMCVAFFFFFL